jgi:hypothetical protein
VFFCALLAAVALCESTESLPAAPRARTVCADAIYSRVPGSVMLSAVELATGLFRDTGIHIEWKLTESGQRSRVDPNDPCDKADLRVLVVASRFSPREGAETVLGEASLRGSVLAYYHRIENYARRSHLQSNVLLGYVMAHELGHVLLRSTSHRDAGLMRAEWRPQELAGMLKGRLQFDAVENAGIRAWFGSEVLAQVPRARPTDATGP